MRQVQLSEDGHQLATLVSEVEAGESVTILRGERPVAQIIPFPETEKPAMPMDEEALLKREAAIQRISEIMRKGIPMGGVPPSRDEMHDGRCANLRCKHSVLRSRQRGW
jgi:antitoxin (DNA-binding transcriptional repressor) of toxin-antitoxin stability system